MFSLCWSLASVFTQTHGLIVMFPHCELGKLLREAHRLPRWPQSEKHLVKSGDCLTKVLQSKTDVCISWLIWSNFSEGTAYYKTFDSCEPDRSIARLMFILVLAIAFFLCRHHVNLSSNLKRCSEQERSNLLTRCNFCWIWQPVVVTREWAWELESEQLKFNPFSKWVPPSWLGWRQTAQLRWDVSALTLTK